MLIREIKGKIINENTYQVHGKLNRIKRPNLPKMMYGFNAMPIKIPARYFVDRHRSIER